MVLTIRRLPYLGGQHLQAGQTWAWWAPRALPQGIVFKNRADTLLYFSEFSNSDFGFPHQAALELDKCLAGRVLMSRI